MQYVLAPFPGFQGYCGIVPNGPAGLVVSFNIRQGLKCKHVASTPTLTMWLLCSNCILPWTTKCLGVFSKTDTTLRQQHSLLDLRPSAEFSSKMRKFLRSLAEYLNGFGLLMLCCYYIFDSYIPCLTLSFNTVYVYFHSHCSVESKNIFRRLCPLNPPLGSQITSRLPSSVDACMLTFPPIVFTTGIMYDICI